MNKMRLLYLAVLLLALQLSSEVAHAANTTAAAANVTSSRNSTTASSDSGPVDPFTLLLPLALGASLLHSWC